MSKTDKTDPWFVKKARYGVVEHDHRDGVCNGEQVVTWRDENYYRQCSLELPASWWYDNYSLVYCGPMSKDERRVDRKKRRAADRTAMINVKYDPENWEDTVDINHHHGLFGGGYYW